MISSTSVVDGDWLKRFAFRLPKSPAASENSSHVKFHHLSDSNSSEQAVVFAYAVSYSVVVDPLSHWNSVLGASMARFGLPLLVRSLKCSPHCSDLPDVVAPAP